jgi:isopropylmalate/homocitrate/citramalate synthase
VSDVQVLIYDTTLRDGTQREGISLSVQDKLKIARILDDLGVAYKKAAGRDRTRRTPLSSRAPGR